MAKVYAGEVASALHQTDQGPEDPLQSALTWAVVGMVVWLMSKICLNWVLQDITRVFIVFK